MRRKQKRHWREMFFTRFSRTLKPASQASQTPFVSLSSPPQISEEHDSAEQGPWKADPCCVNVQTKQSKMVRCVRINHNCVQGIIKRIC